MIYGHGDDRYQYGNDIIANFSTNVWSGDMHPQVKKAMLRAVELSQAYPSPNADELADIIADFHLLNSESVLVCNGATEAFYLIGHAFKGKTATIFYPTFAEYEDACAKHDIALEFHPWESLMTQTVNTDLAFLCNPNNPDGRHISINQVRNIIQNSPHTCWVIDEAYIDFMENEATSCLKLLEEYDNLIIVKSLTKLFTIPGVRLGYVLTSSRLRESLLSCKMPWSVNSFAIESGKAIFQNYDILKPDTKQIFHVKEQFIHDLSGLSCFDIFPSCTHYFLLKLIKGKSSELKSFLAENHKILIRDASNFYGLDDNYIRLCTQSQDKNELLINALKEWNG
ncbi:pyridoxal phosphate-dependent aminotransferase [Aureibacter tunicatorum]|uniref:Threonine-phosphate decarboxylase n=1 Tax=Aureibacter tunicatorum TaxID=866807 RepID=A0AAE3XKD8_9BACT|nr:aminotransferase class I/II-fold pyridoxal phosphate-dependent enzyme [Aureibacter tunicatorum]MDR6237540.1 threonine-phosphate decarboxylase [Aureibacter tunicatorum]BDD02574.1 threonine-phosphate decarboxylase [Aureibacter tunicatorum]